MGGLHNNHTTNVGVGYTFQEDEWDGINHPIFAHASPKCPSSKRRLRTRPCQPSQPLQPYEEEAVRNKKGMGVKKVAKRGGQ